MANSTSYDLRDAKVGDSVAIYRNGELRSRHQVTKVQAETKGYHAGEARRVWLSDGTSWTGRGDAWGNSTTSYWSSRREHAKVILDAAALDAELAAARKARAQKQRRELLIKLLLDATPNLTDSELKATAASLQLEGRVAAHALARFAMELVWTRW